MNQLGAGFAISMKDLEIRGAGNILGPEQSGHIARRGLRHVLPAAQADGRAHARGPGPRPRGHRRAFATGVELELGLKAYLPEGFIPSQDTRLEVLRGLDAIHGEEDGLQAEAMLRDRFGRLPSEARALIESFVLRSLAAQAGLTRIQWRGDSYLIEFSDRVALERATAGTELRAIRTGQARLMLPVDARTPERALAWLRGLLKGAAEASTIRA